MEKNLILIKINKHCYKKLMKFFFNFVINKINLNLFLLLIYYFTFIFIFKSIFY
jgi:hypothetical protein